MGKDGTVYETDRPSAVKEHERAESYRSERDVYLRLRDVGVTRSGGLRAPTLIDFDDDQRVIEMTLVKPPFIVDFASAFLDQPPDFSEDVIAHWHEEIRDRFGERFADVMTVLDALAREAGVYLLDVHPHNLKFG